MLARHHFQIQQPWIEIGDDGGSAECLAGFGHRTDRKLDVDSYDLIDVELEIRLNRLLESGMLYLNRVGARFQTGHYVLA